MKVQRPAGLGAIGQVASRGFRIPKNPQPEPLDMSGIDRSLARSGNMLRKGISRMRQMNRGGKVKLADGGKVTSILKAAKRLKTNPPQKPQGVSRMESPAAKQIRRVLKESDPTFFDSATLDRYVDDYMREITSGETSLQQILELIQS